MSRIRMVVMGLALGQLLWWSYLFWFKLDSGGVPAFMLAPPIVTLLAVALNQRLLALFAIFLQLMVLGLVAWMVIRGLLSEGEALEGAIFMLYLLVVPVSVPVILNVIGLYLFRNWDVS